MAEAKPTIKKDNALQKEFKEVAAKLAALGSGSTNTETLQERRELNAQLMFIITKAKREGITIEK